jgi:hypothetical protein
MVFDGADTIEDEDSDDFIDINSIFTAQLIGHGRDTLE